MQRGGCQEFDDPNLGVQLRYARGAFKADVFLYTTGLSDCALAKAVAEQFIDSTRAFQQAADAGFYSEFEFFGVDTWFVGEPPNMTELLHAEYSVSKRTTPISIGVGAERSHMLLTGSKPCFVKVRFTYPEGGDYGQPDSLRTFLVDLLSKLPK